MAKKKAVKKSPAPAPAPEPSEGELLARAAADYADNKKAGDILVMDLRGLSTVTDFMVLCSVDSLPQLRAVRDEVWDEIQKNQGRKPLVADANMESLWLVLHYGDVMVHIFHREKRAFYSLEELWGDAPRIDWSPIVPAPVVVKKKTARKAAKKAAKNSQEGGQEDAALKRLLPAEKNPSSNIQNSMKDQGSNSKESLPAMPCFWNLILSILGLWKA